MSQQAAASRPAPAPGGPSRLDRYFSISERGSTVPTEIRGGFATFFTMAYIVVLNPLIVGTAEDATGDVLGVPFVATATALVAGAMTIFMGVYARYPLALATGLGLNAFLATAIAPQMRWAEAMGLVVLEGVLILLLVLTGFRKAVLNAIPTGLKTAISVGIGLFLALIGLVDAGFVRRSEAGPVPVQLGVQNELRGWPVLVFIIGVLVIAVLMVRRVRGAILIGILTATVVALVIEAVARIGPSFTPPDQVNPTGWSLVVPTIPDAPNLNLSRLGQVDVLGAFTSIGVIAAVLLVFTLMLADFFDTMGTMVGVGKEAGLLDENDQLPDAQKVLVVDSVGAIAGGAASISSNTTYIESAAGVGEGARTGLASVVTGALFLVAVVATPLVGLVPFEAAAPALVVVGFLMMTQVRSIDWDDWSIAIPAFLTIILMPFTYSIAVGIGAGFVAYVVLRTARGRARDIHPVLWVVAALFVVYFAIDPIRQFTGVS
jgi:AGZA family xanthine/uracil permease-like MFS transporter